MTSNSGSPSRKENCTSSPTNPLTGGRTLSRLRESRWKSQRYYSKERGDWFLKSSNTLSNSSAESTDEIRSRDGTAARGQNGRRSRYSLDESSERSLAARVAP